MTFRGDSSSSLVVVFPDASTSELTGRLSRILQIHCSV